MHLTLPDFVKLMEWKLAVSDIIDSTNFLLLIFYCFGQRGKFRPRLGQLVKENEDDRVVRVTTEAFQLASGEGNLKEGVSRLTELKAVGPATASGKTTNIDLFLMLLFFIYSNIIMCCSRIAPFLADDYRLLACFETWARCATVFVLCKVEKLKS